MTAEYQMEVQSHRFRYSFKQQDLMTVGDIVTTDVDLMSRLCRKDSLALAEIYDRHSDLIYSLMLRITHDASTAEDLVQELFLRLWKRPELFDMTRGSLKGWLLTMARHLAIDHTRTGPYRSKNKMCLIEHAEICNVLPYIGQTDTPLKTVSISRALANLRPCEQAVIELAYFHGYSQREMASLLGQPLGTVKSWTRSALKCLRLSMHLTLKAA